MLDIGWSEMAIILVVALIIIGPKDLPRVMRTAAQALRKVRGMAREFQSGIEDMMRESELGDLKSSIESAADFDIGGEIEEAIDPTGSITEAADITRELTDLDADSEAAVAEVPAPETAPASAAEAKASEAKGKAKPKPKPKPKAEAAAEAAKGKVGA